MNYADEITLIDIDNEGLNDGFQMSLLENIHFPMNKVVISGGIGKKTIEVAKKQNISSAIIENRVLHSENSIADYR